MAGNLRRRIIVIGCGSAKAASRRAANTLYTGTLFKLNRKFAETQAGVRGYFIISAKHGLLRPTTIIDPYNHKASDDNISELVTLLRGQLKAFGLLDSTLVCFAGELYAKALSLAGAEVELPLKGKRLFARVKWLSTNTPT